MIISNIITTRVYINFIIILNSISYNFLSSFRGKKQSVENIWATATEINVLHFNIQRSTNAKDFTTIGTIKAGNKNYNENSFTDYLTTNVQYPKTLYYPIQRIDKDSKSNYTEIKRITIKDKQETNNVVIFPNPATSLVNITSSSKIKQVEVVDMLGKTVMYKNFNSNTTIAVGEVFQINVQTLQKGLFLVKVTNDKNIVTIQKLIIE